VFENCRHSYSNFFIVRV